MFAAPVRRLHFVQELPLSPDAAWDFFSRPENLARITPPDLGFEVTSSLPERMYPGMIVTYRVRPLAGVSVPWLTEITHVREPEFFVDEQRSGPYRFWHHQHHFAAIDRGIRMTDLVHYQVRFGPPGHWLAGGLVRRRLEEIFRYRRSVLNELFGSMER
ncbi:MAG: SRPBCC family protein [Desulfobacterales bacterium]